ncbi:SRPBCC family protein [Mesohalobacter halotolerans]|uniref:SRPBCC family protein n=1 Tax=Mesohalobacter halotolerans TaxID=1883405 RepID=A0A4U5TPY2_9FLAO|nr:SRPBCC family protein [Mesohalobacter halotolerans]MBS3737872.1 SRPBCC family protein [Psychroflexus sp.]TKS55508.1 SRPBCC family protein [Mesohalobacter halotolerans]
MNLETPKITINKSQKELFTYLSKADNYLNIMPDGVEKFEVLTEDSFLFQLKGMPVIQLAFKEKEEFGRIVLVADGGKFPFSLTAHFDAVSDDKTAFQLKFEGEFNAMMAMMIKSPINKFIHALSENFNKIMA